MDEGAATRRVFISYAYDSDEHVAAVHRLWLFLRAQGIDAHLDKAAEDRRQNWPLWMQHQIEAADYILVVASPAYQRRAEGREDPGEGVGGQYEALLLRDLVMRDQTTWQGKILPVLLPGAGVDDIPNWLGPYAGSRYPVTDYTVDGAESLLRVLTGQAAYPPPELGSVPELKPRLPSAPPKDRRRQRRITMIASLVTLAAVAVVSFIWIDQAGSTGAAGHPSTPKTSQTASGALQGAAGWCCQFAMVESSGGYYSSQSASSFATALKGFSGAQLADLTPAGLGVIEINLQTNGDESVNVAAPQVVILSRSANVPKGIGAVLPLGGQGSGSADDFTVDLDSQTPRTIPAGSGAAGQSGQSTFYYVTKSDPETIILTVRDVSYDCTFDLTVNWLYHGQTRRLLLNNGGHHFHIYGSAGLPWYQGNPIEGLELTPVPGSKFPL